MNLWETNRQCQSYENVRRQPEDHHRYKQNFQRGEDQHIQQEAAADDGGQVSDGYKVFQESIQCLQQSTQS